MVVVLPATIEPWKRALVAAEEMPPIAGTVPARALLRANVTPRSAGGWPVLFSIAIPPPLRAELDAIVESWIVIGVAVVWPWT